MVPAVAVGGVRQGGEGPVVVAVAFGSAAGGNALPGRNGKTGGERVGAVDADTGVT
jgi:hypothetical protein